MKTNAVLDRFEGNQARASRGDDEERLVVDRAALPKGVREVTGSKSVWNTAGS